MEQIDGIGVLITVMIGLIVISVAAYTYPHTSAPAQDLITEVTNGFVVAIIFLLTVSGLGFLYWLGRNR